MKAANRNAQKGKTTDSVKGCKGEGKKTYNSDTVFAEGLCERNEMDESANAQIRSYLNGGHQQLHQGTIRQLAELELM